MEHGTWIDFIAERKLMVEEQLQARQINDPLVLKAFALVPRHLFIPKPYWESAYEDGPCPIGFKQTISQPFITAYMLQLLHLTGTERVLEVGTGSGYQAAILSQLAAEVDTIELIKPLAERAASALAKIGIKNVFIHIGDGSQGWKDTASYNAIVVSAAVSSVPKSLLKQLVNHGRMVVPIGGSKYQHLELWVRDGEKFSRYSLLSVTFVPLVGKEGE